MSVLFPKVNKMPTWNWRPIYYDPQKEEMERKLKMLQEKRAAEEAARKAAEEAAKKIAAMDDPVDPVMANAANAYKTAGLSANEYMETVTSFSASLIQSLGGNTAAAAEYADIV